MTADPHDPLYADEATVRREFSRVAQHCVDGGACVDRCGVFPRLDRLVVGLRDRDAGQMTPDEQDRVADACFHCGRCADRCPADHHDRDRDRPARDGSGDDVDMAAMMWRFEAMRHAAGHRALTDRVATALLGRGRLARRVLRSGAPGSFRRRALAASTGLSAQRRAPDPLSPAPPVDHADDASLVVVSSRAIGGHGSDVAVAAAALYSRLGHSVRAIAIDDAGAAALGAGDVGRFERAAAGTIRRLHAAAGDRTVVVLDPVVAAIVRGAAHRHLAAPDRDLAAELAASLAHPADVGRGRIGSDGALRASLPAAVVHLGECHPIGGDDPWAGWYRELGVEVIAVDDGCAGCDGWAWRSRHDAEFARIAARVGERLSTRPDVVVAAACRSGIELAAACGRDAVHPFELVMSRPR